MPPLHWTTGIDLPDADRAFIRDQVFAHGRALAADGRATPLAVVVRQGGAIVAGAAGRTEYGRLFVDSLWVAEPLRCQGLGRALLARIEGAAREAGCTTALIETLSHRAAALYRRCGYAERARIDGYVGPFDRFILLKGLSHGEGEGTDG